MIAFGDRPISGPARPSHRAGPAHECAGPARSNGARVCNDRPVTTSLVSPVLVGREAELPALSEALAQAEDGRLVTALVGGEAGRREVPARAGAGRHARARELRVLTGGCVELDGGGIPFAPIVEMLRALTRELPPAELDSVLGGARGEIGRLVPELEHERPSTPAAAVSAIHPGCSSSARRDRPAVAPTLPLCSCSRTCSGPIARRSTCSRCSSRRRSRPPAAGRDRALRRAAPRPPVPSDGGPLGAAATDRAPRARPARARSTSPPRSRRSSGERPRR